MQIQSSLKSNPGIKVAVAAGTVTEPSVIIRTPDGHHDLLINRRAYSEPNLRRLFLPVKNLTESAVSHIVPNLSEIASGLSVVIDISIEFASVIHESRSDSLKPVDATEQLSRVLGNAAPNGSESDTRACWTASDADGKSTGIISFLSSLKDDRALETIQPMEHVLGQTPIAGDLFRVAEGVFQMLEANPPRQSLSSPTLDPELMEELRDRLSSPARRRAA